MDGIICIDKPEGWTSFDVVAKLRGLLHIKKIGHAGTLDPMATGVLPVFVGKATRAISMLPNHNKSYRAEFLLGRRTDTLDSTGKVISQIESYVTYAQLHQVLERFLGSIEQIPPMFSAVKHNGTPLYRLAREGKVVQRASRVVNIFKLDLLAFDECTQTASIQVACSAGTYIRSLCDDVGNALTTGAVLTKLVRTSACGFELSDCVEIKQLLNQDDAKSVLRPVEHVFSALPKINLSKEQEKRFCNGARFSVKNTNIGSGRAAVYGTAFLGIAHVENELLVIDKLLA